MGKSTLSKRKGKYGRSKYRAFLVMQQLGHKYGHDGYLSTRELCLYAGLPYRSLTCLLPKWVKYEYVTVRVRHDANNMHCEYKLMNHGYAWLECAKKRLRTRNQLYKELKLWVNYVIPRKEQLLSMNFNQFVAHISKLLCHDPGKLDEIDIVKFSVHYPFPCDYSQIPK